MTIAEVLQTLLLNDTPLDRESLPPFLAGMAMGADDSRSYDRARETLRQAIEFLNERQKRTEN